MARTKRTFKRLDDKRVKDGAARTNSKYDSIFQQGVTVLKMKQGVNNLRVVRNADMSYWNETIWVHSRIGSKSSTYLCAKMMGKSKRCSACDAANEAAANGDKDEASLLAAKERSVAYVIDRGNDKEGLLVWDMGWTTARDVDAVCDTKRGVLDISQPDDGYDISVLRTGTGKNTRYTGIQVDRESSPLSDDARQQDAWLDEAEKKPISSLLKFYPDSYIADILAGKIEEKDEDDEEERQDRPVPRNGEARDIDIPDDSVDDRDPPRRGRSEDEREPPRRGRSEAPARKPARDDNRPAWDTGDDEDPDNAPQEEAEPPRRGRGAREDEEQRETRGGRSRGRDQRDPDPEPDPEDEVENEAAEAGRWRESEDRPRRGSREEPAERPRRGRGAETEERAPRAARPTARRDDPPDEPYEEPPRRERRERATEAEPARGRRERVTEDEERRPRRDR